VPLRRHPPNPPQTHPLPPGRLQAPLQGRRHGAGGARGEAGGTRGREGCRVGDVRSFQGWPPLDTSRCIEGWLGLFFRLTHIYTGYVCMSQNQFIYGTKIPICRSLVFFWYRKYPKNQTAAILGRAGWGLVTGHWSVTTPRSQRGRSRFAVSNTTDASHDQADAQRSKK
jgi:hypothetical protein